MLIKFLLLFEDQKIILCSLPIWKTAKIIVGFGVPSNLVGNHRDVYEIFDLIDESKKIEFDNGGDEYDCESGYDFAIGGLLKNKYIYILDSEEIVHPWPDSDKELFYDSENEEDVDDQGPR